MNIKIIPQFENGHYSDPAHIRFINTTKDGSRVKGTYRPIKWGDKNRK
jgi:hypothetical protein